jgi:hypothetical protein
VPEASEAVKIGGQVAGRDLEGNVAGGASCSGLRGEKTVPTLGLDLLPGDCPQDPQVVATQNLLEIHLSIASL